ncbi:MULTISPECIES: hypothetical protein [unclassified Paenibacillus]|uniref:hypothetical protein n=1 Tax=unclassified Paenibacillus TaxID=185978 RepID=UPI001AE5E465|nr:MULTISPECIES: hypothetical protein [unclassified Paenibacillus]MBP1157466.1 hypothetical protein [Paenibacillus sp. PvP091]MBP1171797.1 hypothetical protein [Paenibacillus sp. PvR098]MBP2438178.1 hypothetical protein [Paenibacillus sp. PvP052]
MGRIKLSYIVLAFIFLNISIKIIYMFTAQSTINGEEANIGTLAMHYIHNWNIDLDYSQTRLYSISRYFTALLFFFFGISIPVLKSSSLIFSILYIGAFYLLIREIYRDLPITRKNQLFFVVTFGYVCISPSLLNIWSLKNRGGFIESLFIGTLIIYLTIKYIRSQHINKTQFLIMGYLWGLALWVHPITISYIVVSFFFLMLHLIINRNKIFKNMFISLVGALIGILPLLILNFYYKFNTFQFFKNTEPDGPYRTLSQKTLHLLTDAFPMIFGFKHELTNDYIFPSLISILLIILFFSLILIAFYKVIFDLLNRKIEVKYRIKPIEVILALFILNCLLIVISSWGSFLIEPRRALTLYTTVPIIILYGISHLNKKTSTILLLLLMFINLYSNYSYIKKYPNGYDDFSYKHYTDATNYLLENSIDHIFTNSWYGYKITFESKEKITWSKTNFLTASYGYAHNGNVTKNTAFVFSYLDEEYMKDFEDKIINNHITFSKVEKNNLFIYHNFSEEFNANELYMGVINKITSEFNANEIVFLWKPSNNIFYSEVGEKNERGNITSKGEEGYLLYGPYISLEKGEYRLEISGTPARLEDADNVFFDVIADSGKQTIIPKSSFKLIGNQLIGSNYFTLHENVGTIEFRVYVNKNSFLELTSVRLIQINKE